MPVPLDPGDRKLLIVAGALLVLVVIAGTLFTAPPAEPSFGYPSSYSTASGGAKAAYLLLKELGYEVERWTRPPTELPDTPEGVTLILAEPMVPACAEERSRLLLFAAAGGRILATGSTAASLLAESDVQPPKQWIPKPQTFRAQLPGPLSRQAPEIVLETHLRWGAKYPHHVRYYGDAAGACVVKYQVGKGEVIWWADSTPLENYGISQASNLMLFLNSVGPRGETRVLWDEYFHGQRPGLGWYLARTPVSWAALQLGLLAGVILLTFARRHGPLRPAARPGTRLSPLEFVEAVGELYERKRAAAGALEIAYHRFRSLLLPRLGLPESATSAQIAAGVRDRWGWTAPGLVTTLLRSEVALKSGAAREADALRLVGELHDHARQLRLSGTSGRR